MGRRKSKRVQIELPVTVSGFDGDGNPFVQSAKTVNISFDGVQLRGIFCVRAVGDVVRVQYRGKRRRFSVIWLDRSAGYVGLHAVTEDGPIFAEAVTPAEAVYVDDYAAPAFAPASQARPKAMLQTAPGERRRYPRYSCATTVDVRDVTNQYAVKGRVLDISLSGCYIEMMSPMRVGTTVEVNLEICGHKLHLNAIVRVLHPNMGMGVEFVDVAQPEMDRLLHVIAELSGVPLRGLSPAVESRGTPDPEDVGNAVLRWFANHDNLSRVELQSLVRLITKDR
jgi:hypothetical protein